MIVKEKFDLLRGVDNVLKLSKSEIERNSVEIGGRKIFVNLEMMKNRISHYTKDTVLKKVTSLPQREFLHVVTLPDYQFPVSYNIPTKGMIINLSPFGIDDIQPNKPGAFNLYALMVYAITFSELVSGRVKLTDKYAEPIASYLLSMLIRLFGKQYGLLGSFSILIPKLKFLTNIYILESFFGTKGIDAYKKSSVVSGYNYKEIEETLLKYDFSNINNFILALSDFGIMPNITRHVFAAKCLKFFGLNSMPALEDCGRFIATLTTSGIKGSNIIPTFLSKYNEREYGKIINISKNIF